MWSQARLSISLRPYRVLDSRGLFSDGKYVLTGSGDDTARLWDAATGNQVQIFPGHFLGVGSVAFSPDGKYVATGDDPVVRLWDPTTGKWCANSWGIKAWCPASISLQMASIWQLLAMTRPYGSGSCNRSIDPRHRAAYRSSSGRGILSRWQAGRDSRRRQDCQGMELANVPRGDAVRRARRICQAGSFSPDGKQLVTAHEDGTARIWDTLTGQPLITSVGTPPESVVLSSLLTAGWCSPRAETPQPGCGMLPEGRSCVVSRAHRRRVSSHLSQMASMWSLPVLMARRVSGICKPHKRS